MTRLQNTSNRRAIIQYVLLGCALTLPARLPAQSYDLSWHTIDGGGATFSTGGTFQVGGTIGQPDASSFATPMSGGAFTLVGGFWPVAASVCALPGDMNLDASRDGLDFQGFVNCLLGVSGSNCACADFSGNGSVGNEDIPDFTNLLLSL